MWRFELSHDAIPSTSRVGLPRVASLRRRCESGMEGLFRVPRGCQAVLLWGSVRGIRRLELRPGGKCYGDDRNHGEGGPVFRLAPGGHEQILRSATGPHPLGTIWVYFLDSRPQCARRRCSSFGLHLGGLELGSLPGVLCSSLCHRLPSRSALSDHLLVIRPQCLLRWCGSLGSHLRGVVRSGSPGGFRQTTRSLAVPVPL